MSGIEKLSTSELIRIANGETAHWSEPDPRRQAAAAEVSFRTELGQSRELVSALIERARRGL